MAETKTGEVEAVGSRQEGEFGILLDDDNWYNGSGSKPDLNQGDEVTLEYELTEGDDGVERILVDDHDSIEVESRGSGNGSGAKGTKDDRAVSRQSAAKTVGNMYQGDPPSGADDLLRRYRMIEDIAEFNIRGEWPDRVESGQVALEEKVPDDVEDKIEELSERLGQLEEAGGPEAASNEDVDELEERVSDLETMLENIQAGLKSLKEDGEDQDVIFGDDEDGGDE